MRARLLIVSISALLITWAMGASVSVTNTISNIATSWRLAESGGNDTVTIEEAGIGWADDLMTVQTPVAALQFDETGDPAEPVMIWPGRIVANHIDVTSLSLFTTVPTTSTSTGEAGQMAYDANYFYVCIASNTWKRTALSTW